MRSCNKLCVVLIVTAGAHKDAQKVQVVTEVLQQRGFGAVKKYFNHFYLSLVDPLLIPPAHIIPDHKHF